MHLSRFKKFAVACALVGAFLLGGLDNQVNGAVIVDFTDNPTLIAPSITEGDITVTGSRDVVTFAPTGLGIGGGSNSTTVDPFETISLDFDQAVAPVTDVRITEFVTNDTDLNSTISLNGTFSAYDSGNNLIVSNTVNIDHTNPEIDVSGILGNPSFHRFDLAMNNDGLAIGVVEYTAMPEPGTAALVLGAGAALAAAGRRRRRNGLHRRHSSFAGASTVVKATADRSRAIATSNGSSQKCY